MKETIGKTPGEILHNKRELKKISLKQAADDTNITVRHLKALEEDKYKSFPGETYALGFLRSYANYLDLDAENLIQIYSQNSCDVIRKYRYYKYILEFFKKETEVDRFASLVRKQGNFITKINVNFINNGE